MDPLQIVSTIAIVRCQQKFLLVQRALNDDIFPGKWQNIGGKVEVGEIVEEAIFREIEEEAGLKVRVEPQFLMSYSWKKDEDSPVRLGLIFLLDLPGEINDYSIKVCEELSDYKWVSYAEAEKLDTIGPDRPKGTLGQLRAVVV